MLDNNVIDQIRPCDPDDFRIACLMISIDL